VAGERTGDAGRIGGRQQVEDAGSGTAQLRILLVHPRARGRGLGARLVDECLAFTRRAGYARVKLWTSHPLAAARRIYLSRGFTLVQEEPHHSFGTDLVGQHYELALGC
jgi:GNAT superfamily N-acetyltransferase